MGKHVSFFLTLRLLVLSIRRSSIPHTTAPRFCIFFNRTSSFSKSPSHTSCIVHDNCTHMWANWSWIKHIISDGLISQPDSLRETNSWASDVCPNNYVIPYRRLNFNAFHLNSVSAGVCENQVVSGSRMLYTKMRACNPHEIWNAYPPSSGNILHLHLCYWCMSTEKSAAPRWLVLCR